MNLREELVGYYGRLGYAAQGTLPFSHSPDSSYMPPCQPESAPDAAHGRGADASVLRHLAGAPVGPPLRLTFQRRDEDRLDIRIGQGPWGSGLGLVVQRVHATYPKPLSPLADRHVRAAQFRRDRHVRFATRAPQDDPCPQGHVPIRSGAPGEPLKFYALCGGDFQSRFGPTSRSCHAVQYITADTLFEAFQTQGTSAVIQKQLGTVRQSIPGATGHRARSPSAEDHETLAESATAP